MSIILLKLLFDYFFIIDSCKHNKVVKILINMKGKIQNFKIILFAIRKFSAFHKSTVFKFPC